jgi:hypothetical protein
MLWEKHPWGTPWELREHIVNLMRTCWELEGNMLGNKGKMNKIKAPLGACFSLPIGCMYFWFPKLLVTILGLG